jgi:benzodiazapine receptor
MKPTTKTTPSQPVDIWRQIIVVLTSLFALAANGAANAIPLNGRNTGEISDSFQVLFVPAGYVFAIWLIIYIGIGAYTIYQALPGQRTNPRLRRSGWLFALGSLANGAWIFAWHFGLYPLSLAIMLVLLGSLITGYLKLDIGRKGFKPVENWTIAIPYSLYLGWITVATIANVTAVLSNLGFEGGGVSPLAWTLILLTVGVLLAGLMAFTRGDVAINLVLIWAFAGISVRWLELPVLNVAGFAAAGLVLVLLIASKIKNAVPRAAVQ